MLLPWDETGLELLEAANTPEQKRHLGGVEPEEKLRERHQRYLTYHRPGDTEVLRVSVDGGIAGSVIYWLTQHLGEPCYEAGWEILPPFQGKGLGSAAVLAMLARLKPVARQRIVFATPAPDNPGSNGICRKLGFELMGVEDVEYPKGIVSPHNVWRLDLEAWEPPAAGAGPC